MPSFSYTLFDIPCELEDLRQQVRSFLAEAATAWSGWDVGHSWTRFDRDFSREVGRRGWIGMTWPRAYGGHERSMFERYVVIEEMLAVGAPVGAHWVGDRQSGPLLLRVGSDEQRRLFLPQIVSGEMSFCIGLSEPDAGSDLASLRARAVAVDGGWRINGRKIWTTNAQHCQFMIGLFRTGASVEEKHKGLSQFLIDLESSGIEVRPIRDLTGEAHFNEVLFDDVFVPADMLVGREGDGWGQANAELAFERSGPDRYLSSFPLLSQAVRSLREAETIDRLSARRIGAAAADFTVLREMSISIQGMLDAGQMPGQEAALTKQLGTTFEQQMPDLVREIVAIAPAAAPGDALGEMLTFLTQSVPSFSLRGGTREILRGIIARGLGLR